MSRVCHETGKNVENPYHNMSAVLRDSKNGRVAYTNLEVSLCDAVFRRVSGELHEAPDQIQGFGYAVETQTGFVGGFGRTVQLSAPHAVHGDYRYLDEAVASAKLPKSAADLKRNPDWMEQANGGWQKAEWAAEAYAKLQRE